MASSQHGQYWKTRQRKPSKYRKDDQADASHCCTCRVERSRVLPTVSCVHSGSFLLLLLVFFN
jgi:hypothetical protein